MNKTETKIIVTALELFNNHGFPMITIRQIAKEADMSPGNLNYYFAKKEEIIRILYSRFSEEIENLVKKNLSDKQLQLDSLRDYLKEVMELFYKYRFIFYDFAQLMRTYTDIRQGYVQLVEDRTRQFTDLLHQYANHGILHSEAFTGQFAKLYKRIQMLTDFWLSYNQIQSTNSKKSIIEGYVSMVIEELRPYIKSASSNELEL